MKLKQYLNETDVSNPKSIIKSLKKAEIATHKHQMKRAKILDRQPDGTKVKVGRTEYEKMNFSGDTLWVSQKKGLSSREMAIELGTKLEKLFK